MPANQTTNETAERELAAAKAAMQAAQVVCRRAAAVATFPAWHLNRITAIMLKIYAEYSEMEVVVMAAKMGVLPKSQPGAVCSKSFEVKRALCEVMESCLWIAAYASSGIVIVENPQNREG